MIIGSASLWGARVLDASLGIGWPQGEHCGYGASNTEGLRIGGGVHLKNGLVVNTIVVIGKGLLGSKVGFAIPDGV